MGFARRYGRGDFAIGTSNRTAVSDPTQACAGGSAVGPANLAKAVTLRQGRHYTTLPAWTAAPGFAPAQIDARIAPDAEWILRRYDLRVTAGMEPGHHTHGDGTALDMVPANPGSIATWNATAKRIALDLGWTPSCAANGLNRAAGGRCPEKPCVRFVGYNGYPDHGDPAHSPTAHIHVSW